MCGCNKYCSLYWYHTVWMCKYLCSPKVSDPPYHVLYLVTTAKIKPIECDLIITWYPHSPTFCHSSSTGRANSLQNNASGLTITSWMLQTSLIASTSSYSQLGSYRGSQWAASVCLPQVQYTVCGITSGWSEQWQRKDRQKQQASKV